MIPGDPTVAGWFLFFWRFIHKMERTLVFVDDGFFGLVKKNFQTLDGKPKKYLQTFRNICKKENLSLDL